MPSYAALICAATFKLTGSWRLCGFSPGKIVNTDDQWRWEPHHARWTLTR